MTHKLRATPEPHVVREVDDRELVDLARQGLIHSIAKTAETKAVLAEYGLTAPAEKWTGAKGDEDIVAAPVAMTDPPATASADKEGA